MTRQIREKPKEASEEKESESETTGLKRTTGKETGSVSAKYLTEFLDLKKEKIETKDKLRTPPKHLRSLFGEINPDELKDYCNENNFAIALFNWQNFEQESKQKDAIIEKKVEEVTQLNKDLNLLKGGAYVSAKFNFAMKLFAFLGGILITFAIKNFDNQRPIIENTITIFCFPIGLIISLVSLFLSEFKFMKLIKEKLKI